MKTINISLAIIGITSLLSSCSSIYNGNLSGGDDLYSVKETAVPLGESINDDLSYASYKYQKQQANRNSNTAQNTVYSNNYADFYSPYANNYYGGMGFRHPMFSFGLSNYGYYSCYGYPSYLSYGYNPYYGWGTYPYSSFGYGYGHSPYGYNPYGYNPYGYNPYGYGYYGNGYYGNNYYGNNYYGNSSNNNWNNNSSGNTSTGIHYSGPRSNNSGGGIVTRKDIPNTVGMATHTPTPIMSSTSNITNVRPNMKLTDGLKPETATFNRSNAAISPSAVPAKSTSPIIRENMQINTPANYQRPTTTPISRENNSIFSPSNSGSTSSPIRMNTQETPNRGYSAPVMESPKSIDRSNFNMNQSSPRPAGNFNSGGNSSGGSFNSGGNSSGGSRSGGATQGGGNMRGR